MPSRPRALALLVALALGGPVLPAQGKVFQSQAEALASAFPDADRVEAKTHVLDDAQAHAVESLAQARLESRLVTLYTAIKGDAAVGYALIDVHTVRSYPEAFLIVITPTGGVRSLRMLAFYEPQEYLPPARWLAQFEEQQLGPELALQRRIHGIAGSTLSARAVTGGVRRSLALYEVLVAKHGEPAPLAGTAALGR